MEEARVPFLIRGHAVDGIGNLVVEVVEHWQSVFRLEGIDEVLRGLVEVPSARPDAPAAVEHIRPVGTSVERVVVLIVRVLHGEDALLRVFVLGQEDVAEVLQIAVARVFHLVGVFDHFLHILLVDVAHAGGGLVAVAPGHRQIALGQIGRSGNLVGATAFALPCGQHVVGELEVVDDFLHQLLVGELVVARLLLGVVFIDFLVDPRHLIPHLHQLEIEVGAQESHLALTNLLQLGTEFLVAEVLERHQCAVATRNAAIEVIPLLVHVVGRRCSEC